MHIYFLLFQWVAIFFFGYQLRTYAGSGNISPVLVVQDLVVHICPICIVNFLGSHSYFLKYVHVCAQFCIILTFFAPIKSVPVCPRSFLFKVRLQ